MTPRNVESEIRELEAVRRRSTLWRWGTIAATLLIMLAGVAIMNQAVRGLTQPGPAQDRFVGAVNANLQTNVLPQIQTLATRTITESQPIVQEEITKLNGRMPEVAGVAMKQFNLLQTELPQRSTAILNDSFGQVLAQRKAKIKEMFPNATDAQIETFITNMSEQGQQSLANVSIRLFDRHIETMSAIADNVETIRKAEAPYIKQDVPTWQMGVLIFDIARADMGDLKLTTKDKSTPRVGAQSLDEKNIGVTGTGLEKTTLSVPALDAPAGKAAN